MVSYVDWHAKRGLHMRMRQLCLLAGTLCMIALSCANLAAQSCPAPPAENQAEHDASDAFANAVVESGGCTIAGDNAGCRNSSSALTSLRTLALAASGAAAQCAANGVSGGAPLTADAKQWYVKRFAFWLNLYQSLQQSDSAVTQGVYKISDYVRSAFLGVAPPPKPPTITSEVIAGSNSVTVKVDVADFTPSGTSDIYVCV